MLINNSALAQSLRNSVFAVVACLAFQAVALSFASGQAVLTTPVLSKTERLQRVLFITAADCAECDQVLARLRRPGGDFEHMRTRGWIIGEGADSQLQIVDREKVPEFAEKFKAAKFPVVVRIENGEIVRSFQTGCTTPLDAWTFGWLAKGVDERPKAPVLETARVETTGHYALRGNHWSIDGDSNPSKTMLVSHLHGPVHGQQVVKYGNIDAWSYEELRSLHDNLHEIEMGGVSTGSRSTKSSDTMSATRKSLGRAF